MVHGECLAIQFLAFLVLLTTADAFILLKNGVERPTRYRSNLHSKLYLSSSSVGTVEEASQILAEWDRHYNPDNDGSTSANVDELQIQIPDAIQLLNNKAAEERNVDSNQGRCMLGICASSAEEGIATLKSWVNFLGLPRGLLHGMDKDGVPLEIDGGVYIKYNTGGSLTFSQIRQSGMGFDALWKPGDALLEPYDGTYRGVYFQVELSDGEFRQYLVPLDTFGELS